MVAFFHAIPVPVLRFFPLGLAIILVAYCLWARQNGWQRKRAQAKLGPIVLVLSVLLLAIDLTTTLVHRH